MNRDAKAAKARQQAKTLRLKRQKVRTLSETEIAGAHGGQQMSCRLSATDVCKAC